MTSNMGIIDNFLTVYLSEGMMIFTFILFIVSIISFIKSKKHSGFRMISTVIGIYCILYLGVILYMSFMFGSHHKPAAPSFAEAEEADYAVSPSSERVSTNISGSFTATVHHIIPDYVLDDVTPMVAVVTRYQSQPFTVYLGTEMASQVEEGASYKFEIEEKEVMIAEDQLLDHSMEPEIALPLYSLSIASVVKVDEIGIDDFELLINEQ